MEREHWLLCALIAVAPLLYYLTTILRLGPRSGRLPPGPRPLPLIGNLLDLRGGNLHHALACLARVHGPVMRLDLGPLTTAIIISSRDAAREAFARHDRALAARAVPDVARAAGFAERSMIWLPAAASDDPRWKAARGVVAAHAFSPRALAAARAVRERKARELVGHFRRRAGRAVDVGQAVYGGVLNLVSGALFSVDVVGDGELGAEAARGLRELVEEIVDAIAKPNVSDLLPFLAPLDLQGWRRWAARRFRDVFRILDGIIDRRLSAAAVDVSSSPDDASEADRHGDFLDALLDLLSAGKMTRDNVTTIMFDVFAAGTDTISVTVEWAMAELLRNPGAMAKARAEIEGSLGSKDHVEEHDAASLPYLQSVVKEAMRLHPVAPIFLPHQAAEDGVEIGGYAVPKGCTVIFLAWSIMRDPAAWERPDEFVPERFLDREEEVGFRGKEFEFIPFGAGRRQCPGLPMAERVVPLVLASLLHAFEWRLPDGVSAEQLDVSEKFTTANVLAVPLRAVPVPVPRTK